MNELTREQILSMEAGRELDVLVAEHVMNIPIIKRNNETYVSAPGLGIGFTRRYSTDIVAAWEVLEQSQKDWSWEMNMYNAAGEVEVRIGKRWIVTKSVSESICKAALLAVMGL